MNVSRLASLAVSLSVTFTECPNDRLALGYRYRNCQYSRLAAPSTLGVDVKVILTPVYFVWRIAKEIYRVA